MRANEARRQTPRRARDRLGDACMSSDHGQRVRNILGARSLIDEAERLFAAMEKLCATYRQMSCCVEVLTHG